MVNYDQDNWKK